MAKTILRVTEIWACDSEDEANRLLDEKVETCGGDVSKKTIERKTKKSKGVIIDEKFRVTIQVDYNEIFGDYADE